MAKKKKRQKPIRKFKKELVAFLREILIGLILILLDKLIND